MDTNVLMEKVKSQKAITLYFKNDLCSPCLALRPKINEMIKSSFPNMDFIIVDTVKDPMLSNEYNVFANPTILTFFEGKEYIRKSKYISVDELKSEIDRLYKMIF